MSRLKIMSIAKFSVGRRGMSGRHASYITRESASHDISFHNLDELRGENDHENRVNAIAHAYSREDVETAKGGESGRTHYKLILSWDRKEETDRARDEAHEFLKENFEKGRGFVAIHQDTEHTHAHVWLDARGTDERKLHLSRDVYKQLDERWARQYDRAYNTDYAPEYAAKKEQTREWKRELVERSQSEERTGKQELPIDKPERARDDLTGSIWREKELRDTGVGRGQVIEVGRALDEKSNEESRVRGNQQSLEVRNRRDPMGERAIENSQRQLGRAEREISTSQYQLAESERTVEKSERAVSRATGEVGRGSEQNQRTKQAVRELQPEVERVAERKRNVERDQARSRSNERDIGFER